MITIHGTWGSLWHIALRPILFRGEMKELHERCLDWSNPISFRNSNAIGSSQKTTVKNIAFGPPWCTGGKVVGRLNRKCSMGRMRVVLWVKKWNTELHTATAAPHVCWLCILVPYFSSRALCYCDPSNYPAYTSFGKRFNSISFHSLDT